MKVLQLHHVLSGVPGFILTHIIFFLFLPDHPSQLFIMARLSILHWNDVYRVRSQKVSPTSSETIDVTQFAGLIDDLRAQWPLRDDGKRDGLSLFSGDVFSPSVDSSVILRCRS